MFFSRRRSGEVTFPVAQPGDIAILVIGDRVFTKVYPDED